MASLSGLPVPKLDWTANDLPQAFRKFKSLCQLIFDGPLSKVDEATKVKYLQIWTGEEGIELVSTWTLTDDDAKKLNTYWTRFESYVTPKSNFRLSSFKLRSLKQEPNESVDSFVKRIRLLVKECQYQNEEDHMIDALIFGTNSVEVQSKLLQRNKELKLEDALDIARTEEITKSRVNDITRSSASTVQIVQAHAMTASSRHQSQKSQQPCNKCGREHNPKPRTACPAYGTKCTSCGKRNHWATVCRSTNHRTKQQQSRAKKIHTIDGPVAEDENDATLIETLYFDALTDKSKRQRKDRPIIDLTVSSSQASLSIPCKIDTGADGNVLPITLLPALFPKTPDPQFLEPSDVNIEAYGGNAVHVYGKCSLTVKYEDSAVKATFQVAKANGPFIIGYQLAVALKLVTMNFIHTITEEKPIDILDEYRDCFQGIGCFPGEFHIDLKPDAVPVVHAARRIPEALLNKLEDELKNLTKQDIITPVIEPTDWVNSIVCVTKPNGSLRLCLDPKDLNAAIRRPYYRTPTLDDILPKLNGAKYFTILDARSGYWNIKLSNDSSLYTTFNAGPYGRYRFLRLPFGLSCAQDVFQRMVDETFGDLPGVTGIADDIVIFGSKEEEHDANLRRVLERARERGIRFNPDKTKLKRTSIPFFGNIISAAGLEPHPAKIEAIKEMKPPSNVKELQTILGLATYLSRFTPNLSELTAPLRELCRQDAIFTWEKGHQEAFEKLKERLISSSVLRYFDKDKPLTIQVDASIQGLGAVLLQENGPVEYASKSLSEAETRYSNIEREMLAILFGLERFHYYAYGRHVTVETDHKPLESIFKKHLEKAPPRLSRMLLRIQKYDINVKYVPGKSVPVADALSRNNPRPGDEIKDLNISVHEIESQLNASPMRLQKVRAETATDKTLQCLISMISSGWPDKRSLCPDDLIPY